jgi:hypothetical protein
MLMLVSYSTILSNTRRWARTPHIKLKIPLLQLQNFAMDLPQGHVLAIITNNNLTVNTSSSI